MNATPSIADAGPMVTREYEVRFLTPAFLGNAGQSGQWRTPPFKHLLRQWWRVAWAQENDPADWQAMRKVEGRLFGHAWLEKDHDEYGNKVAARRSLVRLRLVPWSEGTLKNMPRTRPVGDGRNAVASHLYLGYGPVKSASELKMAHPLDPDRDRAALRVAWPEGCPGSKHIERALALIHAFGTIGGRCRNGWGSLAFDPSPLGTEAGVGNLPLRDWHVCLNEQWAHAIGEDENGPLVWRTEARPEWKAIIEDLAAVRKAVNGLAKRRGNREVVNQPVAGKGGRVPSNLRFKVRMDGEHVYGVIFHMPFLPEGIDRRAAEPVWEKVHTLLDQYENLQRSPS